jgi:hypothetical protein
VAGSCGDRDEPSDARGRKRLDQGNGGQKALYNGVSRAIRYKYLNASFGSASVDPWRKTGLQSPCCNSSRRLASSTIYLPPMNANHMGAFSFMQENVILY